MSTIRSPQQVINGSSLSNVQPDSTGNRHQDKPLEQGKQLQPNITGDSAKGWKADRVFILKTETLFEPVGQAETINSTAAMDKGKLENRLVGLIIDIGGHKRRVYEALPICQQKQVCLQLSLKCQLCPTSLPDRYAPNGIDWYAKYCKEPLRLNPPEQGEGNKSHTKRQQPLDIGKLPIMWDLAKEYEYNRQDNFKTYLKQLERERQMELKEQATREMEKEALDLYLAE